MIVSVKVLSTKSKTLKTKFSYAKMFDSILRNRVHRKMHQARRLKLIHKKSKLSGINYHNWVLAMLMMPLVLLTEPTAVLSELIINTESQVC